MRESRTGALTYQACDDTVCFNPTVGAAFVDDQAEAARHRTREAPLRPTRHWRLGRAALGRGAARVWFKRARTKPGELARDTVTICCWICRAAGR